jgi:spoIIIJ-associated protein
MLKQNASLDVSANTVDEAIELGLAQLGLSRERVDIEIIKEGKRGVFGIGAEKAVVRLTPRSEQKPAAASPAPAKKVAEPAAPVKKEETRPAEPSAEIAPARAEPKPASRPVSNQDDVGELAASYLFELLKHMGINAQVTPRLAIDLVEEDEEPPLVLDVTGDDLGILIGRRSETLQALQFMVRLMVNRDLNRWEPIVVDVQSYRVRRRRSLRQMAEKMAERAAASRKRVVLEAMPPHERRIIHIALRNHPDVMTKSVGSEENRKVTIVPKQ